MTEIPEFPIRGNEVSFTAKVLAVVGDGCTANILRDVEGQCAWIQIHVTGEGNNVFL
jgi:hypothetical protein